MSVGFVAPVPVRWSDIDVYQHINHATMVTILEESRVPFHFTLGYEVRSVNADPECKPAVVAESQLAAVHIEERRLVRLTPQHREYLQRWIR